MRMFKFYISEEENVESFSQHVKMQNQIVLDTEFNTGLSI